MPPLKNTSLTQICWTRTIREVSIRIIEALENKKPSFICPIFNIKYDVPAIKEIPVGRCFKVHYAGNTYRLTRVLHERENKHYYSVSFIEPVGTSYIIIRMFYIPSDLSTVVVCDRVGQPKEEIKLDASTRLN